MGTALIVIHLFICIFLVFVILLQPGKSDGGIGFGGSSQSIFGSAGASNFLTKTTSACAILFLITSFVLTRSRLKEHTASVMAADEAGASAPAKTPAPATPAPESAKPAEPAAKK